MLERLKQKKIHGVFAKQSEGDRCDRKATYKWLKSGYLRPQTVCTIIAAQDGVTRTAAYCARVLRQGGSEKCHMCGYKSETLGHIMSMCAAYKWTLYKQARPCPLPACQRSRKYTEPQRNSKRTKSTRRGGPGGGGCDGRQWRMANERPVQDEGNHRAKSRPSSQVARRKEVHYLRDGMCIGPTGRRKTNAEASKISRTCCRPGKQMARVQSEGDTGRAGGPQTNKEPQEALKSGQTLHSRTDHEPDGLHATRGTVLGDPNCETALPMQTIRGRMK